MSTRGLTQAASQKLLTVNEAANRLAVTPSAIRRRILERRIAFVKIGRCVRIPESAIELLISDGYSEPITLR
jgi:excisionase family DNA binding protein